MVSEEEMRKRLQRGQISDDDYLAYVEKKCGHSKTEVESFENGAWKEWCDDCGKLIGSGSGGTLQPTAKGGCVVVIASLGTTAYVIWQLVESIL